MNIKKSTKADVFPRTFCWKIALYLLKKMSLKLQLRVSEPASRVWIMAAGAGWRSHNGRGRIPHQF